MITSLIDRLTRLALRYKWITLGLVVLALVAGLFALTQLNQELIPSMEFPASVVLAPNNGATAEQMREQVTIPIENAVKDIDGVVNVQSTTTNGLAYLMIMNEFGLDQEEFRAELRAALDKVALPNGMKKPQLVNFSFDDLPLVYAGVSAERPLPELKALVAAEIVPALKGVPGVADVQIAGGQELPAATPTPAGQPTPAAPPTPSTAGGGSTLPPTWQAAGQAQGVKLEKASDVTPIMIQMIAQMSPQMLDTLTPQNLKDFSAETRAALPPAFVAKLDPQLQAELAAPAGGGSTLPPMWQAAGQAQGVKLEKASDVTPAMIQMIAQMSPQMLDALTPQNLKDLSPETRAALPPAFVAKLDPQLQAELQKASAGAPKPFIPESTIATVDGNPALLLQVFKDRSANTVSTSHALYDKMDELKAAYPGLRFDVTFEQSSFIEESISGVTREGALGAFFAVVAILIFLSGWIGGKYRPAWRSALVTGISIPLSVFMAFALLTWLPSAANLVLDPLVHATADIPLLGALVLLIQRLFPTSYTLNIITLSGMTVAVGRVVDDSIVVQENIYRHIQSGEDLRHSVLAGVREVAIPILASTVTTVIVFLPVGLVGGIVGQFFLPFGVTVAYALAASFLIAVTVVPLLAYLFIRKENLPEARETTLQRWYTGALNWSLRHRAAVLIVAGVLFIGSLALLGQQPRSLLPDMGEPSITITAKLPDGTTMAETAARVAAFEQSLKDVEGLGVMQSQIGAAGGSMAMASRMLGMAASIDQTSANSTIGIEDAARVTELTAQVRQKAEQAFGADNTSTSGGAMMSSAMSAFSLILSGDQDKIAAVNDKVVAALEGIDGLANVTSNLAGGSVILRVDGQPAVEYSADVESRDAMGMSAEAKTKVQALLPAGVTASEGFASAQQTQAFQDALLGLLISIIAVYVVMVITFRSLVHPFIILFSLPLALIGAGAALWITDGVVGLPVLIGLMMLVGIVVTNAIVLIDRVNANRKERGMGTHAALLEGGRTRLRPILMTAVATMLALVPLAIGVSEGAIIAADLAKVVIGGLLTSTLLTLVVVPVVYSLLDRKQAATQPAVDAAAETVV